MRFKARLFLALFFCWAGLNLFSVPLWAEQAGSAAEVTTDAKPEVERSSAAALLAGDQPILIDIALTRYEQIAADGGWPVLPEGTELSPGSRDSRVRILRRRLRATGDYLADMGADPLLFDDGLRDALMVFQRRHGLHADGIVAGQTLDMLNLSVADRITQLKHARAGWRKAPVTGNRHVWVNIPEAVVTALDNTTVELQLRAVVGHPTRPTPQLSSTIRRLVVNPSWTVPQSIAGEDLLPRQLDDSQYFSANGFRVFTSFSDDSSEVDPGLISWSLIDPQRFPYRLLQEPGPKNSLGRFKFDFPNEHDVYMHDTPSQALLGLSVRSLSAGCVRVQDPDVLAQWLFRDHDTMQKVVKLAARDDRYRTRSYLLDEKVPVDFVYLSAWVAADGEVQFRRDVYQLARPAAFSNVTAE